MYKEVVRLWRRVQEYRWFLWGPSPLRSGRPGWCWKNPPFFQAPCLVIVNLLHILLLLAQLHYNPLHISPHLAQLHYNPLHILPHLAQLHHNPLHIFPHLAQLHSIRYISYRTLPSYTTIRYISYRTLPSYTQSATYLTAPCPVTLQSATYLTAPLPSSPYREHTENTRVIETLCFQYCKKTKQMCRNACTWSSGECNWWPVSCYEPLDTTPWGILLSWETHVHGAVSLFEQVGDFGGAAQKFHISVLKVLTANRSVLKRRILYINFGSIMVQNYE